MNGDLFKAKAFAFAEFFQEVIVALPSLAKAVVIADDHGMRAEPLQQEILDILFGRQLGESLCKGNDDKMVYLLPG